MAVEARFYVAEVHKFATAVKNDGWAEPRPWGKVVLRPVTRGEANKDWASSTPSGQIDMTVAGNAFPWFEERLATELRIVFDDRPADEV